MRLRRGGRADARGCSAQESGATGAIDRVSGNFSSVKLGGENSADAGIKTAYADLKQVPTVTSAAGTTATSAGRIQQLSLQVLESWLLQWPAAAYKAQENPQLPAVSYCRYCDRWSAATVGVEAIAPVGAELSYDPQLHQLLGTAQQGQESRYATPATAKATSFSTEPKVPFKVLVTLERMLNSCLKHAQSIAAQSNFISPLTDVPPMLICSTSIKGR